ncbi:hypothetical protein BU26DRAFT_265061 [Trematosphaeria pertusa]|uniref:F-box domain-containing protein n=1 Tax=Trematosphaeria pertusa TaxID=390896 RepID=A0A6A6IKZ7_9PLEO|nr:uncharacterized protein BU26DRAFT_265061 [Trematosphaeria pertusa]KAF2250522.1 hypothetical protein BU26DRAFT_265061 [Trematosphaeria pertusa]
MPALGNLRLSCKELESETLWYFTQTYFREVNFMPSKYALEALFAMSKSRMAYYVRTLGLGPPSNDQSPIVFHNVKPRSKGKKEKIRSEMYEYGEVNREMRAVGEDTFLIRSALQNLRWITKLEFLDPFTCYCGTCLPHRSYGMHYLYKTVGSGIARFSYGAELEASQSLAKLFHVALHACQAADLRLECVDAHIRHFPLPISDEIRFTGFSTYPLQFPSVRPRENPSNSAFADLTILKLFIAHTETTRNDIGYVRLAHRIASFLVRAPKLRTLALTFGEVDGSAFILEDIAGQLSNLRELELIGLRITWDRLCNALCCVRTHLCCLKSWDFTLTDDKWCEMLAWLRDSMQRLKEMHLRPSPMYDRMGIYYQGDALKDFLNETIERWEKTKGERT